ncbi:MAG TPA: glycerol-3-phosphate 1-O-acyltransferase PlsY [Herpetosiphonaceae bacterium]
MVLQVLGLLLIGYLVGSIPFSFLVAKTRGVDLRTVGSGNTGASNVWRTLGFRYFVVALILDIFKGWLPAFLAHSVFQVPAIVVIGVGICAVLGHVYPVFLGFKGGKAVATTGGVVMGFAPVLTALAAIVWTIVYKLSGYPSVASMVDVVVIALTATAMTLWGWLDPVYAAFLWVAVFYVFYLHRANIQRLLRGQEHGIGPKDQRTH